MTALNFKIHRRNHSILIITFLLIIYGGIIFYFSHHDLWLRLEQHGFTDNSRDQVRQLVIEAILTRPFLGFGYGSFESVFPLFQTLAISGNFNTPLLWNYAHNSYLELAFELGIPATLGLIYCLLKLVKLCFLGLYCRKRNWIYPAIGLSASSLACLHASVDFSLQIPAVAYTYAMIIGIACAQSFSTQSL
jgi:O-antigen ligase